MPYDVPQVYTPEEYQARIEKMSDEQLEREGKGRTYHVTNTAGRLPGILQSSPPGDYPSF